jgi:glycosyltransferase involved in cell wall biosynthesis
MRVLLVTHFFPPDGIMGVERYTRTLASALTEAGDTVSVLARRPGEGSVETSRERMPEGTAVYRITGAKTGAGNFLVGRKELEQHFARVLFEEGPDVVHFNHLLFHPPRSIELVRRLCIPIVFSLHDFYLACPLLHLRKKSGQLCKGPDGGKECSRTCFAEEGADLALRWGIRLIYFRKLLRMASQVICPSRYVASFFQPLGIDSTRLHVVPNGLWIEPNNGLTAEPPRKESHRVLTLAYLGAVVQHKGLHVVLDALSQARLPAVRLLIYGPCPEAGYVSKLRQKALKIAGLEAVWHGAYENTDLPRLLCDADVAIIPSQVPETFSFVAREALACGSPVIVSRLGALGEIVREGSNGFTFTHDRPQELASLLIRIQGCESLRRHLRNGARASSFLSLREHAVAVRDIYQRARLDEQQIKPLPEGEIAENVMLEEILAAKEFESL